MKSGGSGASSATRSPGATPASRSPSAIAATRSASAANESERSTADGDGRRVVVLAGDERSPRARRRLAGRRRAGCSGRGCRLEQPLDPGVGERGDVLLLDDEVPCQREAVELGLRQPPRAGRRRSRGGRPGRARPRRAARARRARTGARPRRPAAAYDGCAGVVGMSATKSAIACRSRARRVGTRGTRACASLPMRPCAGRERRPQEERRPPAGEVAQQLVAREADRQRHARRRHRDARVGEQDPEHALAVLERPAERDRAAPVVGRDDDRAVDLERVEDAAEVVDALRERPRAGALARAPSRPGRRRPRGSGRRGAGGTSATCSDHVGLPCTQTTVSGGSRAVGRRGVERVHLHRRAVGERHREGCATRPARCPGARAASHRTRPARGSPDDLDDAGVEPGSHAHAEHPVACADLVLDAARA